MSSHHFVKEDQEPALLIIDPEAIAFEKVQELLEWSPLVIVSQCALEVVQDWGIKIDVLYASHDSSILTQIAIDQAPLQIIHSIEGKNELTSICEFLIDRKQIHLHVIVNDAKAYFTRAASFSDKVNVVLFDGNTRWHFVANGLYSKWLPSETFLQTYINDNLEKSVAKKNGVFKIERKYSFWVGEPY